jgi:hypothetical protein
MTGGGAGSEVFTRAVSDRKPCAGRCMEGNNVHWWRRCPSLARPEVRRGAVPVVQLVSSLPSVSGEYALRARETRPVGEIPSRGRLPNPIASDNASGIWPSCRRSTVGLDRRSFVAPIGAGHVGMDVFMWSRRSRQRVRHQLAALERGLDWVGGHVAGWVHVERVIAIRRMAPAGRLSLGHNRPAWEGSIAQLARFLLVIDSAVGTADKGRGHPLHRPGEMSVPHARQRGESNTALGSAQCGPASEEQRWPPWPSPPGGQLSVHAPVCRGPHWRSVQAAATTPSRAARRGRGPAGGGRRLAARACSPGGCRLRQPGQHLHRPAPRGTCPVVAA